MTERAWMTLFPTPGGQQVLGALIGEVCLLFAAASFYKKHHQASGFSLPAIVIHSNFGTRIH